MAVTLSGMVLSNEAGSSVEEKKGTLDPIIQRSSAVSLTAACMSGRLGAEQLGLVVRTAAAVLPSLSGENRWEAIHSFLLCLEEAFARCSLKGRKSLEVQPYVFPIWKALPLFLLSNHQWVRLSAARLLGRHLSSAGGKAFASKDMPESALVWSSNDLVRELLRSSCLQLEANILAPALAKQILENLLCMAEVLRSNPRIGDLRYHSDERGKKPEDTSSDVENDLQEGRALHWLIARVSGIASKGKLGSSDMLRRGCALRFLLVSAKRWDVDAIRRHSRHYINPVVKILESGDIQLLATESSETKESVRGKLEESAVHANDTNSDGITGGGLRILAQTLQESLTEVLGATEYFEVYTQLRSLRAEIKQTRKRNAALLAAADPERAAKKRRKKAEYRRRQKKKKPVSLAQSNASDSVVIQKRLLTEDL
ncbi:small subunit processome component 20 [Gracilaria domingensis]|nr:small subunit processome component 20 [Gracilaria domingensis]